VSLLLGDLKLTHRIHKQIKNPSIIILGMNTKIYKQTKQRELILSILKGTRSHPPADWIYEEARKNIPKISKGTVYRNLVILLEKGEIEELGLSGTISRYEAKQTEHYHIRCSQCGKVVDVNIPVANQMNLDASKATGFKVTGHRLEFHGYCKDCQIFQYINESRKGG
jgi:Fur family transcriptional regulator, peroxide stress response regulator